MSARERAERLIGGWLPGLSSRRRDWVKAALAELPELPDGRVFGWALGVGAIAAGDLLEQSLLPWRRDGDARPPARFAAGLGLVLLLAPLCRPGWTSAGLIAIALSLWINLAAVVKARSLGGLLYEVSVRRLPLNLLAILLAGIVAFVTGEA